MSRSGSLACALVASALVVTCAAYEWPAYGQPIEQPIEPFPPMELFLPPLTPLLPPFPVEWPAYRHDTFRTGDLPGATALSNPLDVQTLAVRWGFPEVGRERGRFRASPIVVNGTVFIGSTSGIFYALDASSGDPLWQYPIGSPPLTGSCGNPASNQALGNYGIQSSASFARIGGRDAVVFGAPDPDPNVDGGRGSARLWALDAVTGTPIWNNDGSHGSEVVAQVTGCRPGNRDELHERIAYSSPLILGSRIYVGIHNAGDNPIQQGKVRAVNLTDGHIIPGFRYAATMTPGMITRGGGVWNSPASDGRGVYFTTGNTQFAKDVPEPDIDDGLGLIRVDPATGEPVWRFQPLPFGIGEDPDWAAGAAVMSASCGERIVSVPKDGWTYAVNAADGSCAWQFPPTGHPGCIFPTTDMLPHGDDDYKQPAAVWGDVLVIKTGGHGNPKNPSRGYTRLHALNACADDAHRVRWIAEFPSASATPSSGYSLGAPTITHGIVYVTTDKGHVVALADPSVCPAKGYRCSHKEFGPQSSKFGPPSSKWEDDCVNAGNPVVPVPTVLVDVPLPDGGDAAGLRNEPALANGMVFVGTGNGHVYALGTSRRLPRVPPELIIERQCP